MNDLFPPGDANAIHRQTLELFGNYVNCGMVLCNEHGEYATTYINDTFARYLGYDPDEFMRKYAMYLDCVHPEDRKYVQTTISEALKRSDRYDLIYRVLRKGGGAIWIRENGRRVQTRNGEKFLLCLMTDISADADTRRKMELEAQTDVLTGCLNRATLSERLHALLDEAPRDGRLHILLKIDLDHLQTANDRLGHLTGDHVLTDVAQILKKTIRAGDLLGRVGGDEFMLCLRNFPRGVAADGRMSELLEMLRMPLSSGITLTCSLGAAFYPQDGLTFETLRRHVDLALREAKSAGGDRYVFYRPGLEKGGHAPQDTPIDE